MSKGRRIDIKQLNAETLEYIRNKPSLYCTYETSLLGNAPSLPTCTEFGMNRKFCKLTKNEYKNVKPSSLFRMFESLVMLDQFDLYLEFLAINAKESFVFQEKGIQQPDMVFDPQVAYAATLTKKRLDVKVLIFIEKYALDGVYYEKMYPVLENEDFD